MLSVIYEYLGCGCCCLDDIFVAMAAVTDNMMSSGNHIVSQLTMTRLALDFAARVKLQSVVQPHLLRRVDEVLHHFDGVVWSRSDAQQLLSTRHRRVVDWLQVYAVLQHQFVCQLHY